MRHFSLLILLVFYTFIAILGYHWGHGWGLFLGLLLDYLLFGILVGIMVILSLSAYFGGGGWDWDDTKGLFRCAFLWPLFFLEEWGFISRRK